MGGAGTGTKEEYERMSFKKPLVLAVVAALTGAIAVAGVAIAANNNQTLDAKISPSKLPKKKYKPAKITVDVSTSNDADPAGTSCTATGTNCPAKTEQATILFDKDLKFNTKAVKNCTENLEGTSTDGAKDLCPKSVVGKGGATVYIPGLGVPHSAVVTAFDGCFSGHPDCDEPNSSITLHSRLDIGTTTLLVGTLENAPGAAFGKQLRVPVAELPANAVIAQFDTAVKKGKYVQARCSHKKWKFTSDWQYHDGSDVNGVADSQKCKVKR